MLVILWHLPEAFSMSLMTNCIRVGVLSMIPSSPVMTSVRGEDENRVKLNPVSFAKTSLAFMMASSKPTFSISMASARASAYFLLKGSMFTPISEV